MKNLNLEYLELIERKLDSLTSGTDSLTEAMRYSLLCGGKRIRPSILLEFYKISGGKNIEAALPYACALEMVHTYSLIHDDLPCMDDDDLRRGKPSNHVVNGEDIALLAGDALLTLAFETMLDPENLECVGVDQGVAAAFILAKCAGWRGMILGQVVDLKKEGKESSCVEILDMYKNKTANLIIAASLMGTKLACGDKDQISEAVKFGTNIGLSFQIADDILDITADEQKLGKPVGSDSENKKCTYVSLVGMAEARAKIYEFTANAVEALKSFNGDTTYLEHLSKELQFRSS